MPDHIFISYARDDQQFVLKLKADLEKRGIPVWLDTGGIRAGESWRGSIVEAIMNCAVFLIVLSPKAVVSRNVVKELSIADGAEKRIIPLVYQDHELTSDMEYQLAGIQRLDFRRGRYEDNLAQLVQVLPRGTRQPEKIAEPISMPQPTPVDASPEILRITIPFKMELVCVPAGEFLMGSDLAKDKDSNDDEQPQHPQEVAEFYIGKYPVTNAKYEVFANPRDSKKPRHWKNGKVPKGKEDHPVVYVSWYDALAFCKWLRGETGKDFQLPSEVEWEYAARGGSQSKGYRFAGSNVPNEVAWYKGNSQGDTHAVGGKQPNELGLYDMSGNVWEWTRSQYRNFPYNPGDGREDLAATENIFRVLRGGAFDYAPWYLRCAYRFNYLPDYGYYNIGFRVVVSPSASDL